MQQSLFVGARVFWCTIHTCEGVNIWRVCVCVCVHGDVICSWEKEVML